MKDEGRGLQDMDLDKARLLLEASKSKLPPQLKTSDL
jgi:hypothetical protein